MSFFGVRVNGVPKTTGYTLTNGGGLAIGATSSNVVFKAADAGGYLVERSGFIDVNSAMLTFGAAGTPDIFLQRIAANRLGIFDNSTTAGTLRIGLLEFSPAASVFAQVATITNGPRAANPVAWAEVSYNNGASTGRVPIW